MSRTLIVRIRRAIYAVPLDEIIYMENKGRKIHLHAINGDCLFYGTFQEVISQLDEEFLVCGRSYILNKNHIKAMRQSSEYEIIMDNSCHIPFGRNSFLKAKQEFDSWITQRQGHQK